MHFNFVASFQTHSESKNEMVQDLKSYMRGWTHFERILNSKIVPQALSSSGLLFAIGHSALRACQML